MPPKRTISLAFAHSLSLSLAFTCWLFHKATNWNNKFSVISRYFRVFFFDSKWPPPSLPLQQHATDYSFRFLILPWCHFGILLSRARSFEKERPRMCGLNKNFLAANRHFIQCFICHLIHFAGDKASPSNTNIFSLFHLLCFVENNRKINAIVALIKCSKLSHLYQNAFGLNTKNNNKKKQTTIVNS